MPKTHIEQVLFGYLRGHRVIASSLELDPESNRLLRSASDMAFDGAGESFLSILPVPGAGAHAFIKTWPAEKWTRPGSVWSHVLLVKYADLGKMDHLSSIPQHFRLPKLINGELDEEILSAYRIAIDPRPAPDRRFKIDPELASRVLPALYGSSTTVRLLSKQAGFADETLMGIFEQQWPRLRRTSSFRTRYRSSDAAWRVDLEILERLSPKQAAETGTTLSQDDEKWVSILLDDLAAPTTSLRHFLRRYGAEGEDGRSEMRPLTQLFQSLASLRGGEASVIAQLRRDYPGPSSMKGLKRDLFGRADGRAQLLNWPSEESARIRLAMSASEVIDLTNLEIVDRLINLVISGTPSSLEALGEINFELISPDQVEIIISEVVSTAPDEVAVRLAVAQPDLGVLISSRKPLILAQPIVWDSVDEDMLLQVFSRQDDRMKDAILDGLLSFSAEKPLTALCSADPTLWWRALARSAKQASQVDDTIRSAGVLRRVLNRVGAAVLDAPKRRPASYVELITVLLAADMNAGLWKQASTSAWLKAAETATSKPEELDLLPDFAAQRFNVAVLLSAAGSGQPALRQKGWAITFAPLHEALQDPNFDQEAWSVLSSSLPRAEGWDRSRRLRRGAVAEIKRDKWDVDATQRLLAGAIEHREDMKAELFEPQRKKKKKTWLQELLDMLQ